MITPSPLIAFVIALLQAAAPAPPAVEVSPADRAAIEAALPGQARVPPVKPRKLLVFDLNVGYPGHGSIAHANLAFTVMGEKTGAFEATVSRDPAVFKPDSLRSYDAVFFNNTVGNCFEDPALRQSLVEFVYRGGGLLGVHGTTVAFTRWPGAYEDWPEFGIMLGGRGARHRESDEHVFLKLDDPDHPLAQPFGGKGFDYRDEFFRVDAPYSRDRVRVLLSIDTEKTDLRTKDGRLAPERADNDYAIAWVRNYGRGRVFYCTIGHHPRDFSNPLILQFYLGAIQFALGDLPAPATPNSRLTPAVRARERLGWSLAAAARSLDSATFFDAIEKTAGLGLLSIVGSSSQKVSAEIQKSLDGGLSADEQRQIRLKLDAAGVRVLAYALDRLPADGDGWRRVFDFCRAMGIETIIAPPPPPDARDAIERLCSECDITLAARPQDTKAPPGQILERIGTGLEVVWVTGGGELASFLRELHRLGPRPTLFCLDCPGAGSDVAAERARCVEFFNSVSVELARPATETK
jgi:type 1 glutamine amidotransferase